jgi:uncharacterized protein
MVIALVPLSRPVAASSAGLVISQVYGGGGNNGATPKNDYIELFNAGTSPVSLAGWSVQYASTTGTSWQKTDLTAVTLQPGGYYLVQEAQGAAGTADLPTPDATGTIPMAGGAGKVALVTNQTPVASGTSCPTGVADLVGYGTGTNCFEGTGPTSPALTSTTAALRNAAGCVDTDSNAADFAAAAPNPRNSASPAHLCTSDEAPSVASTTPASGATDVATDATLSFSFSEPVNVASGWFQISCPISGSHAATQSGGPTTYTLQPAVAFAQGETCSVTIASDAVSDQDSNDPPDGLAANYSFSFTTASAPPPPPPAPTVVLSQLYGGGGNSGATLKNDFIELYNRGSASVALTGWTVQYASAAGTSWATTPLSGSIASGGYYLIQEAAGATGTTDLPSPDAIGTIPMAAGAGKVVLVTNATALSGACPSGTQIADLVGYGTTASCFEGSGSAPAPSNTTADLRAGAGAIDTNNNASDFATGAPNPRNSGGGTVDAAPRVTSTSPGTGAAGVAVDTNISVTFSEPVSVSGTWFTISCASSAAHTASVSGGPGTFTIDPATDFSPGETCTVTISKTGVSDQDVTDPPDNLDADYVWNFTTAAGPPVTVHEIQGASHISPKVNQTVSGVAGIVTGKLTNGFYLQDPNPDSDPATSEGVFVFTSSAPAVSVGDAVKVSGKVQEFRPGGSSTGNLTTTEISGATVSVVSTGNPLPAASVVGNGGRVPPDQVIEDDASSGNVETSGVFDPDSDGLDFWESLEGMRVQLNDAVAVGPTATSFGETPVVGDNGANAGVRTARGGVLLGPDDGNPERIIADDAITALPAMNVGDRYDGALVGVVDYNFGNFFLEVTQSVGRIDGGLQRETTTAPSVDELTVGTFNFENLDPTDPASKFAQLATYIVQNLRSPDLIGGEEVQDNNGATDNGTVAADATLNELIGAIQAAGGPTYDWREIDPVNDQDGGEPGGNIRQVFLFRTDRGLSFVDRPGGTSTAATAVTGSGGDTALTYSPGRIDPTNPNGAWTSSRKPLAGEFLYRGQKVFVIVNHFNSKGGDDPLSGRFQPPVQISAEQRHKQATIVANFVSQITAADANANVIVLGDLNDFEFSETATILKNAGLHDFIETLPLNQRYSYEFEGNAQVLDHIMGSGAVLAKLVEFDAVHVNAEFADQASDHDPSVIRVLFNRTPTAGAGGPYAVSEGSSITVTAIASDPEGDTLTYAWDLDNNGTFETPGQTATFSAASIDGPTTRSVAVRATDSGGLSAIASATITVSNVAPTATFNAPASVTAGSDFVLSLSDPFDPSGTDTSAGFTYAFDCGTGYAAFRTTTSVSCPTTLAGDRAVGGKIQDKDGGVTEYRGTVHVVVTADSLCALTKTYANNVGISDSLCAKLASAASAREGGKVIASRNILTAFANEVEAQRGKAITSANADTLIALARSL